MYKVGSKIKVAQSNGVPFRDNPNYTGTVLYEIPNETILTILDVYSVVDCFWVNVEYLDSSGWIVADNGVGTINIKVISKPKRRHRRSSKAKKTGLP